MRVVLLDCGDRKINVIREIRAFTGKSLKEAKDLSEQKNALLFDGDAKTARNLTHALRVQGALVSRSPSFSVANVLRTLADWIES